MASKLLEAIITKNCALGYTHAFHKTLTFLSCLHDIHDWSLQPFS